MLIILHVKWELGIWWFYSLTVSMFSAVEDFSGIEKGTCRRSWMMKRQLRQELVVIKYN